MAESAKPEGRRRKLAKAVFDSIMTLAKTHKADIAEASGSLGALVKSVEDEHGVNRKAFKMYLAADRMEQSQLADFLRSFDELRKLGKLDERAGKDLFAAEESEESEAAARSSAGDDDDKLRDLRPDALRLKEAERLKEDEGKPTKAH